MEQDNEGKAPTPQSRLVIELTNLALQQLDAIFGEWQTYQSREASDFQQDSYGWPQRVLTRDGWSSDVEAARLVMRAKSAIERITGIDSAYEREFELSRNQAKRVGISEVRSVMGIVAALRDDIHNGTLESMVDIVHAALFADYMDMADHLLGSNYKDAAAVIVGSSLEAHLRLLGGKHSVEVTRQNHSGAVVSKAADQLNIDLHKAGAYSESEKKQVSAWLTLRNDAAHGHYDKYTQNHIRDMSSGVRRFLTEHAA